MTNNAAAQATIDATAAFYREVDKWDRLCPEWRTESVDPEQRTEVPEQWVADAQDTAAAFRDNALVLIPGSEERLPLFVVGRA